MQRTFSPLLPIDILSHRAGHAAASSMPKNKTAHRAVFIYRKEPRNMEKKRKSYCGRFQR